MNKNKRWPKYIPVLNASDFEHGYWEGESEGGAWCGQRRCMVGWVGSVFHNNAYIYDHCDISGPCRKFLFKIAEFSGHPVSSHDCSDQALMAHVSNVFEGGEAPIYHDELDNGAIASLEEMSSNDAAKIWRKTMEFFGYTELMDTK